jgi:transcription antitermination factor NusG
MLTLPQSQAFASSESLDSGSRQDLWHAGGHQPKWYAVFTYTRHEKRVFAQCEERQIESFLPLYQVKHRWKNRCTVDLELPLFPSYSFVRIDPHMRVQVLQLPGVIAIVSSGREPIPLPDEYINSLREGLLVHRIEPHSEVVVGDWVRIRTGPMTGAEGILERWKNGLRVVLRLEMLARSVSVEVGADAVERCDVPTS